MLGALIIVFREVIEAGIIVGIVMAVTQGVRGSRLMAGAGVAAGIIGAGVNMFSQIAKQQLPGQHLQMDSNPDPTLPEVPPAPKPK